MYLRITVGLLALTSYVYFVAWAKRKQPMVYWLVGTITSFIVVMAYYGQEYLYLHMDPIRAFTTGRPRPDKMVDVAVGRWGAVAGYVPVLRPHAAAAFVYFHGNGCNAGTMLYAMTEISEWLNADVYVAEYRSYGRQWGLLPSEGLVADANAVVSAILSARNDTLPLYVWGTSLGNAAVTGMLVTHGARFAGAVLEDPWTSLPALLAAWTRLPARLLGFVMRSVYPNEAHVRGANMPPLLMLSAGADGVIPPTMHMRVFEAYNNTDKKKLVRPGGQHAQNMEFGEARLAMKAFVCAQSECT